MIKVHGLFAAIGILSAAAASATPISGSSLQNQLTALGANVDVQTDQSAPDQEWRVGATHYAVSLIELENSAYANGNSFGIYDIYNPSNKLTLFAGANIVGDDVLIHEGAGNQFCAGQPYTVPTCASFSSNKFGFFLSTPAGNTFYSAMLLNNDGVDHMVAFEGGPTRGSINGSPWLAGEYILGWEDLYGGGDRDYEDFVVLVESIVAVPESISVLLLAMGLLGGLAIQRRRLLKLIAKN